MSNEKESEANFHNLIERLGQMKWKTNPIQPITRCGHCHDAVRLFISENIIGLQCSCSLVQQEAGGMTALYPSGAILSYYERIERELILKYLAAVEKANEQ